MKNDCVFCAISAGEIPSFKVYEDESFLAYLDINPCSTGHTLVIPKKHVRNLSEADDETLFSLIVRVRRIAGHIKDALGADGFNILQNNGEAAGQSVHHLHFHIVPRYAGSPPLDFKSGKGDMAALAALAEKIRIA